MQDFDPSLATDLFFGFPILHRERSTGSKQTLKGLFIFYFACKLTMNVAGDYF
jgi:hypothetical protein